VAAAPGYYYAQANHGHSESKSKQPLSATWEPLLEAIPGCNGLGNAELLEVSFLVVLDASWVAFYQQNEGLYATQGYATLEASPRLMFDRVSYLFEAQAPRAAQTLDPAHNATPRTAPEPELEPYRPYTRTQFGLRLTIGRVEAFANLTEKCSTNNKEVENGVKDSSNTFHALEQRGVTDSTGVKGGIVRLGVGSADGTYCHSSGGVVCYGSCGNRVSQLSLLVFQRHPFQAIHGIGRVNFYSIGVLAHEMGHAFGM